MSDSAVLRKLETPSVYQLRTDQLYELDETSFAFLQGCATAEGCATDDQEFLSYCRDEGILGSEPRTLPHPLPRQTTFPSLRYLELQITDRCNLSCSHCYIGGGPYHDLDLAAIRQILGEFSEMQGLRVMITGGEPLIHPEFEGLNRLLPDFRLRKVLFTNGVLLSDRILADLRVDEVQVSIDGIGASHDAVRGKGTCAKVMDAVQRALRRGIDVSVSTMVHARNLEDFDEMERTFRGLGIREWTVDVPCATGRLADHPALQVPPEVGGKFLGYGYGGGMHGSSEGYGCGLHLMAVMADGHAAKCTFYADRNAGHVRDGLRNCWARVRPIPLSSLSCDCAHLETCRGGCRYRAALLGDERGKDLYRCGMHDILEQRTA